MRGTSSRTAKRGRARRAIMQAIIPGGERATRGPAGPDAAVIDRLAAAVEKLQR